MRELLLYLLHGYIEVLCTRKIGVCESITDHNFLFLVQNLLKLTQKLLEIPNFKNHHPYKCELLYG